MSYKNFKPTLFLGLLLSMIVLFDACKSQGDNKSLDEMLTEDSINLDFSINGLTKPKKDRIGIDLMSSEYEDDPKNEDFVMHVTIGDSIYFKDISTIPEELASQRKWYIGTQQLPSSDREVAWFSDIPGTVTVSLKYDDDNIVQKGIYLVENLEEFGDFEEIAEEEIIDVPVVEPVLKEVIEEKKYAEAKTETKRVIPEPTVTRNEPVVTKPIVKTVPPPVKKATPKKVSKPKPVEIQNVDFSVNKTVVEVGSSVVLRDQSTPASAVNMRVWDFGDGNNMTTRGSVVSQTYTRPGEYTVKLCLNYSSKCTSKIITVKPAKQVLVKTPPKPKPKPAEVKVEKPSISKVYFSMPSSAIVGKPVQMEDSSVPRSAVTSRKWYVNGKDLNLDKSKVSRIFDKAGKYEVRLCVNGSQKDCHSTIINVKNEVKKVVPVANTSSSSTSAIDEFFCVSTKKGGIRNSQRCTSDQRKLISENTKILLKPSQFVELRNATVYGNDVGFIDIKLTSSDSKVNKTVKKLQVLPGRSVIEFGDLALTLEKGIIYTLEIILPSDGSLKLEDAGVCNTSFAKSKEMDITYEEGKMAIMDLKFCY